MAPRPRSAAPAPRPQASTRKASVPAPAGKPARKGAPAPTRSPAIHPLEPHEWPKSHPLVGKSVTFTTISNKKPRKAKVLAGDDTVLLLDKLWFFCSSVTFI